MSCTHARHSKLLSHRTTKDFTLESILNVFSVSPGLHTSDMKQTQLIDLYPEKETNARALLTWQQLTLTEWTCA
jgi:hypothetical protein